MRTLASAMLVILFASASSFATECLPEPVRPVECACGTVVNPLREPVPNAKVTVLQGSRELSSMQIGPDGKFSFQDIQVGSYQIRVQAEYYNGTDDSILLVKSKGKPKWVLLVMIGFGVECDGAMVVKAKHS